MSSRCIITGLSVFVASESTCTQVNDTFISEKLQMKTQRSLAVLACGAGMYRLIAISLDTYILRSFMKRNFKPFASRKTTPESLVLWISILVNQGPIVGSGLMSISI